MPYYRTLREDVQRAKEILERGKTTFNEELAEHLTDPIGSALDASAVDSIKRAVGGTIYGADTYAAYKLLESFVEVIETMDPKVCELAMRARRLGEAMAAHDDAPPPSITCPQCGRTSYNRNDIEQKYCGACHRFHDEMRTDAKRTD